MIWRLILTCALSLIPVSGWAAISHDATSTSQQVNVTTPSYTHTRGAVCGNPVAVTTVTFQDSTPGTISGVTYGGAAMTSLCGAGQGCTNNARQATGSNIFSSMWIYKNPSSGGATVQATFSESMNSVILSTSTYCGVDQTTPTGTFTSATDSNSPVTVNVTSAAGELVVDGVGGADVTYTVGAGQTERSNLQDAGNHDHMSSDEPGAASVTMSWTQSASHYWATIAGPLKPAASTSTARTLMLLGVGN